MAKKYHGILEINILEEDGSKKTIKINVYKNGNSIYLKDDFGEILVYPSNEKTKDGWVNEYRIKRNIKQISIKGSSFELKNY